ncbi:hypothetical protein [Carnobacterium maltaromaticum]|uniref:hypothetical protein n=1 Tax=Carnobacterium maltaromaticum TaxID=2751 RepID=UPI00295F0FB4|nr:hypothetical protein [Carnobacterium maltaromaticum]
MAYEFLYELNIKQADEDYLRNEIGIEVTEEDKKKIEKLLSNRVTISLTQSADKQGLVVNGNLIICRPKVIDWRPYSYRDIRF